MIDVKPSALTIGQAGTLLRSGKLSAVELTEALLQRISETDPLIHAYVEVLEESALLAARRADADRRAGLDHGPLHGIPIGIKDIFDVQGVPTRCGARLRADAEPAIEDAPVVAALRRGGAILIGKTVTQEYAAGVVSVPARNPWDPVRIPGGSSGGSGASVAAGSCLGALGSDTGGSVRIPASVNGVIGLKPTYGLLSTDRVYPLSWSLDTVGPLTKTVEDAALLVDAMIATRPERQSEGGPIATGMRDAGGSRDLRGVRLGVPRPYFFDRLQPGVAARVEEALARFVEVGAEVIETPWPDAQAARAVAFLISRVEALAVHEEAIRTTPELIGPELRTRLEAGVLTSGADYVRSLRVRLAVKRSMQQLFETYRLDALVTPTTPATALKADHLYADYGDGETETVTAAYTRLTMPFNATGQPALTAPCGFDGQGLPVGLQLAGRPFAEAALCRIGHAYEQAAGWSRRRPPL